MAMDATHFNWLTESGKKSSILFDQNPRYAGWIKVSWYYDNTSPGAAVGGGGRKGGRDMTNKGGIWVFHIHTFFYSWLLIFILSLCFSINLISFIFILSICFSTNLGFLYFPLLCVISKEYDAIIHFHRNWWKLVLSYSLIGDYWS